MQTGDSIQVIERFIDVMQQLVKAKRLRGRAAFHKKYGAHVGNFARLYRDRTSDVFQQGWLAYLVKNYNTNPAYLLTCKGQDLQSGQKY